VLVSGLWGQAALGAGEEKTVPPAAGRIAAGAPRYAPRDNAAWRERGRIVGQVRSAPAFKAEALDAAGAVAAAVTGRAGAKGYEIQWLAPGVYSLRVSAEGYGTLVVAGLEVKAMNDLVLPLEFSGGGAAAASEAAGGTLVGILTAKGINWIEVKAEGQAESKRYIPEWRGGMPENGGGPDEQTLAAIKRLPVSNLVRMDWTETEGHLRVLKIEMIAPEQKEGAAEGTVVARGDAWIDVKPAQGYTERYMPRWIGGMPKDGGGLDRDMLRALGQLKVGDAVRVRWVYDERKRVVEVQVAR